MVADGAHLGSLGADDDVTAVAALPHGDAALLKDSLGLHILQQCAVTLFVGLLDSSNPRNCSARSFVYILPNHDIKSVTLSPI